MPAIFYRPSLSGYAEVARIDANGVVRVSDPSNLDKLSPADLVALVRALST